MRDFDRIGVASRKHPGVVGASPESRQRVVLLPGHINVNALKPLHSRPNSERHHHHLSS